MTSMPAGDQGSDVRVSDAERDDIVSRLSEHFQAGRLTADEFDERAGLAIGAKTRSDLTSLMTDLPGGAHGLTRQAAQPATGGDQALRPRRGPSRTAMVLVVVAAIAVVTSLLGHGAAGHVPWGLLLVALFVYRGFFRGRRRAGQ
jgi:Domain of unknown function (DUF1707)